MRTVALLAAFAVFSPTDGRITAMHETAGQYWDGQNVPALCASYVISEELPFPVVGRALLDSCAIVLDAHHTTVQLREVDKSPTPLLVRRNALNRVCDTVVHEEGHLRGLAHSGTGVMAIDRPKAIPECQSLARVLAPRPRGPKAFGPTIRHRRETTR